MQHSQMHLGFDVGGTKTLAVVTDDRLEPVASVQVPTQTGQAGLKAAVQSARDQLSTAMNTSARHAASVGIALPGLVDHRTGVVTAAVNLGIAKCHVVDLLAALFDVDVRVENDVKAAALGAAHTWPSATGDLTFINIGTGIACATVAEGRLLRGSGNRAGELGHLALWDPSRRCSCGQNGCSEAVAGGGAIQDELDDLGVALNDLPESLDPRVCDLKARIVTVIADIVTTSAIAYDSTTIALGGGVISNASWLPGAIIAELDCRSASSEFLTSMRVAARIRVVPPRVPIGAVGAAIIGIGEPLRATAAGLPHG